MRQTIRTGLLAVAILAAVVVAGSASAETPTELLTALNEKAKAATTAETTTTTKMKNAYMETTVVSTSVSKREADGTTKFRTESKSSMKMTGMDQQDTVSLSVSDGKTMWTETDMGGTKQVMKMAVPQGAAGDLTGYLDIVKKEKATVLPDEVIDGANCAVLQIEQADGNTMTLWLDEANGVARKMVMKGELVGETVTKVDSLKTGVAVDDSKFTYTPPADAQVTDLSTMQGM